MSKLSLQILGLLASCFLFGQSLWAHNGVVGYAYPLGNMVIDGDFSDWPRGAGAIPDQQALVGYQA